MSKKTFVEGYCVGDYWRNKPTRKTVVVEKRVFVPVEIRPTMREKARWLF